MSAHSIPVSNPAPSLADRSRADAQLAVQAPAAGALNAVKSGIHAQGLLLPHESVDDYRALVASWMATLSPATPGDARLVVRIADVDHRLTRLDRAEQALLKASVERAVDNSEPAKKLSRHGDVEQAVIALGTTALGTRVRSKDVLKVILPTIRLVAEWVGELELGQPATPLLVAIDRLARPELEDDELAAQWSALPSAVEAVIAAMSERSVQLKQAVEAERLRVVAQAVASEPEARKIHRQRLALQREIDKLLATLQTTKALSTGPAEAPFCPPLTVDLRLVP